MKSNVTALIRTYHNGHLRSQTADLPQRAAATKTIVKKRQILLKVLAGLNVNVPPERLCYSLLELNPHI